MWTLFIVFEKIRRASWSPQLCHVPNESLNLIRVHFRVHLPVSDVTTISKINGLHLAASGFLPGSAMLDNLVGYLKVPPGIEEEERVIQTLLK